MLGENACTVENSVCLCNYTVSQYLHTTEMNYGSEVEIKSCITNLLVFFNFLKFNLFWGGRG